LAVAKKPTATPSPLSKTYGERPVPFQFPGSQDKMYIGSEVSLYSSFYQTLSFILGGQLSTVISWNTL
jgi:hypothetical protein